MKKKDNSSNGLFGRRLMAFLFDMALVSFVAGFICAPFLDYDSIDNLSENATQIMVDYKEGKIDSDAYLSHIGEILYRLSEKQGLMSLVTLFLNVLYFVVYQFYNKGQTLGKKLFGLKIVSNDSKELTMDNYIYRSSIINSILINMIVFALLIFASQETWFYGTGTLMFINYIILFICGLMVIKSGRGLHDLVGNTKVIDCRK